MHYAIECAMFFLTKIYRQRYVYYVRHDFSIGSIHDEGINDITSTIIDWRFPVQSRNRDYYELYPTEELELEYYKSTAPDAPFTELREVMIKNGNLYYFNAVREEWRHKGLIINGTWPISRTYST